MITVEYCVLYMLFQEELANLFFAYVLQERKEPAQATSPGTSDLC